MSLLLTLTEGWTQTLDPFTLKANGTALSLSGMTVELIMKDVRENTVDTAGDLTVDPDQGANPGVVRYAPDAADFVAARSPYSVHFKVTDGSGNVAFFPNGAPDQIVVEKV